MFFFLYVYIRTDFCVARKFCVLREERGRNQNMCTNSSLRVYKSELNVFLTRGPGMKT